MSNDNQPTEVEQPQPTEPPRFTVFFGNDGTPEGAWVLRDRLVEKDYPFFSRETATSAIEQRRKDVNSFIGAPMRHSIYGEPTELDWSTN